MRSEKEMIDLILDIARKEEAVRLVVMNGSRVNPNVSRDPFQDFDIIYFVTDVAPFVEKQDWLQRFGELMILQTPEAMGEPAPEGDGHFSFLMQFKDGNRMDLSLRPLSQFHKVYEDSLTVLLLDKDGIVETLPAPTEKGYLPKPPTPKQFEVCCNEFWWVSTYVAKALWRGNIFHAKDLLDCTMQEQLMKMLDWYFGLKTNFQLNPGKGGKNYSKHLDADLMAMLKKTYTGIEIEKNWNALLDMISLFRKTAQEIADKFGLQYPAEDDKKVTAHLEHVRRLPADAKEIY